MRCASALAHHDGPPRNRAPSGPGIELRLLFYCFLLLPRSCSIIESRGWHCCEEIHDGLQHLSQACPRGPSPSQPIGHLLMRRLQVQQPSTQFVVSLRVYCLQRQQTYM